MRLAIPSKGRLQEATIKWFAKKNLSIERTGSEREYAAHLIGVENVEIVLMSAGEIPQALYDGRIDMGVTGQDLIAEELATPDRSIELITEMGFGHADLVLAIPSAWVDVADLEDLDAVCADFRTRFGFRLRIATKYHRLVGDHLRANDVTNFQLVDSRGATEGAVANEYAEMIADITSSGETLQANHLQVLGEPILRSQACLFAARGSESKSLTAMRRRLNG